MFVREKPVHPLSIEFTNFVTVFWHYPDKCAKLSSLMKVKSVINYMVGNFHRSIVLSIMMRDNSNSLLSRQRYYRVKRFTKSCKKEVINFQLWKLYLLFGRLILTCVPLGLLTHFISIQWHNCSTNELRILIYHDSNSLQNKIYFQIDKFF